MLQKTDVQKGSVVGVQPVAAGTEKLAASVVAQILTANSPFRVEVASKGGGAEPRNTQAHAQFSHFEDEKLAVKCRPF